ncbi:MAG TPA: LLM class flavin-dependent oxidoreductase [Candidatus Binataceae bacterium]|jgi:alkanesulfonate monooxygenase SsuD/methylene tetrahydromethanopterin reductase-like flavin-dependent oxidoreductase (luciferase family)|nr:LLM class flavin-dependent oxidoreductase [Candidatus Binataceae bacterium]
MKFGMLYEMETPRPWNALSEYNIYWQALAQIELADRIGIDYVWEVEHHFLEEYSHSSAPEVFYGAVSQRTKNIRIAHGVRLLPFNFNNPIKVAEQAAVLDIMSNGRMELGTGRSTTAQELDGFSVDYDRTRQEVREALEIIVKAWTDEILEFDGKLMKIPPRRVVPKPIQKPHPPMWMACVAPDSYELAGDRGLGALSFSLNFEQVQKSMEAHKKAFAKRSDQVPKVPNDQFAGLIICHVAENKEEEAIGIEGARWFMHNVAKLFEPLMVKNKLYSYEYLRHLMNMDLDPKDAPDAQLKQHHMVVVGNPDEVCRKLEAFEKTGIDQVIMFKQAGRIPHQNIMKSLRLIGKHVLPHFNPHRTIASEEISLAAAGR